MNAPVSIAIEHDKVPLKANAFRVIQGANAQLLPLFPYMGPGAIVPCASAFDLDGKDMRFGYFLHQNSVDEVAVTIASDGRRRSGDVFVGPRLHGVGGDAPDPFYSLMIITQRQLDEGRQPEAMIFQCESCNSELYRYEFDEDVVGENHLDALPTILGSDNAASGYNSSEETRSCKACGHVSKPFPIHTWGWHNYQRNTGIVRKAADALAEATN